MSFSIQWKGKESTTLNNTEAPNSGSEYFPHIRSRYVTQHMIFIQIWPKGSMWGEKNAAFVCQGNIRQQTDTKGFSFTQAVLCVNILFAKKAERNFLI